MTKLYLDLHLHKSQKNQKFRGQNKAYSLIGTFDSKESIDIKIKEQHKEFCYFYTRNTKAGKKIFYRCRHSNSDQDVVKFIEKFKKCWIDKNCHWYEGYNHPDNVGSPSTNNDNESINATIKTYYTLRSRFDMNTFLAQIMNTNFFVTKHCRCYKA